MENKEVNRFLTTNHKYFDQLELMALKPALEKLSEEDWLTVNTTTFKDPTMMLIVSLFAGMLGIDRFLIGDTGKGVGKLLTFGGLGIWAFIDWFNIQSATKKKNKQKLQLLVIK